MALLHMDSFQHYASSGDLQYRYETGYSDTNDYDPPYAQCTVGSSTRRAGAKEVVINGNSSLCGIGKNLGDGTPYDEEITVGLAMLCEDSAFSSDYGMIQFWNDTDYPTLMLRLRFTDSGGDWSWEMVRGTTIIETLADKQYVPDTWVYIEVQALCKADSTGSYKVRIDDDLIFDNSI